MSTPSRLPRCVRCKWLDDEIWGCAAFPDGIPEAIWHSEHEHTEPYSGDHGIQFEPREDDDEE